MAFKKLVSVAFALFVVSGCRQAKPETQQFLDDAAAALGGADRIRAVKTLTVEGEGSDYQIGQNPTPGSDSDRLRWILKPYKLTFDPSNPRVHLKYAVTVTFPWVLAPVRQTEIGIDGQVGYAINSCPGSTLGCSAGAGTVTPMSNTATQRLDRFHHPLALIAAALQPGAKLDNMRQDEHDVAVDVTTPSGERLTLALDKSTKLPAFISSMRDQPNLGDVEVRTAFADYETVDGLKLPRRLTRTVDRYLERDLNVTKNALDSDLADLSMPAEAKPAEGQAAARRGPPTPPKEVAPGLWHFYGGCEVGCDASVLVEFSDHLELIEVPTGDARTLAVIAMARALRPGKPLTKAIVTHHHFDHAGGLRAAISEGLTIVTHETNKAYFEELAQRPHTIRPDALARTPKPLHIETLGDHLIVKDALRTMEIYHIDNDPHAVSAIMVYFPKEQILVEGDPFNPPNPKHVWAPNLYENIKRRQLIIATVVPIHGQIVSNAVFMKAVQSATSTASH